MLYLLIAPLSLMACSENTEIPNVKPENPDKPVIVDNVSGEYYDRTKTGQPERPYIHDYSQLMMMKMTVAWKDGKGGTTVKLTYDECLDYIKMIDQMSRGVKKIVYIVGGTFLGHDDGYPAFDKFNEAMKRPQDATAKDSYFWLVKEAAKYNTLVSMHLNINDAYTTSPYWHTYYKNDLLCKNADGSYVIKGGERMIYRVNLKKEWEMGLLQKRIDGVIEMLDLKNIGTLHLDVFHPDESPYHGTTMEDQNIVMRKVLRYFRDKGVDITREDYKNIDHTRTDYFIGLTPAVWWNNLNEDELVKIRPELSVGGRSGQFGTYYEDLGFLFGENMMAENILLHKGGFDELSRDFCKYSLQFFYLNKHKLESYDKTNKVAKYSGNVVVSWKDRTVTEGGRILRKNNDMLFPIHWTKDKELIAYSEKGYGSMTWELSDDWKNLTSVAVYPITANGIGSKKTVAVNNGKIILTMKAGEMLSIRMN